MLRYIIDGWNLVHKIPQIKNRPRPQQDFVSFIKNNRLTGSKNNRVTIVFDGYGNINDLIQEKDFRIIYSQQRSADDVIIDIVRRAKHKKQLLVVSDDRQIISQIKSYGANYLSTSNFLKPKNKNKFNSSQGKYDTKYKKISRQLQKEITDYLKKKWLE
jgi:predicted RNA-binding protein with PIN domain